MANKPLDTTLLDRAIVFAVRAHAGTERRGKGFPKSGLVLDDEDEALDVLGCFSSTMRARCDKAFRGRGSTFTLA